MAFNTIAHENEMEREMAKEEEGEEENGELQSALSVFDGRNAIFSA